MIIEPLKPMQATKEDSEDLKILLILSLEYEANGFVLGSYFAFLIEIIIFNKILATISHSIQESAISSSNMTLK